MGEGPAEEGRGGLVVVRGLVQEDLKEGEIGDEKEKTDNRVEEKYFSSFSQQLLHVDPAPLGLGEPSWHLGHDGGVEGVANRDEEGAGCLPDAWQGWTSPAGKCSCSEGGESCEQEAGEQGSQLHLQDSISLFFHCTFNGRFFDNFDILL